MHRTSSQSKDAVTEAGALALDSIWDTTALTLHLQALQHLAAAKAGLATMVRIDHVRWGSPLKGFSVFFCRALKPVTEHLKQICHDAHSVGAAEHALLRREPWQGWARHRDCAARRCHAAQLRMPPCCALRRTGSRSLTVCTKIQPVVHQIALTGTSHPYRHFPSIHENPV